MHIAPWLVAVLLRNSFIAAFSGEFQNLRSDASSRKRTSAVRVPTGQLPSGSERDLTADYRNGNEMIWRETPGSWGGKMRMFVFFRW
jgi:hypothetical protein